jgi:dolichol-phosphate mannosyltransferase
MTHTDAVDLTMVIPTYNERARLDQLLERIFAACDRRGVSVGVVIVDDNSSDGTGQRADEWALTRRVRAIHRPAKLGLGSAVLDGFSAAESDVVGVIDADLSHPPELIPELLAAMRAGDLDMVVASRYVPGGGTREWSMGRLILSRLGCRLSRRLTTVHDAMSGFFLLRRDVVRHFDTPNDGFKIGLELLVRAPLRRVAEVGYVFVGREEGESKMTFREGLMFLRQIQRLYTYSRSASRSARPEPVEGRATL